MLAKAVADFCDHEAFAYSCDCLAIINSWTVFARAATHLSKRDGRIIQAKIPRDPHARPKPQEDCDGR